MEYKKQQFCSERKQWKKILLSIYAISYRPVTSINVSLICKVWRYIFPLGTTYSLEINCKLLCGKWECWNYINFSTKYVSNKFNDASQETNVSILSKIAYYFSASLHQYNTYTTTKRNHPLACCLIIQYVSYYHKLIFNVFCKQFCKGTWVVILDLLFHVVT